MRRSAALALAALTVASLAGACTGGGGDDTAPVLPAGPATLYVAVGASETVGVGTDDPIREAWPQVLYREALPTTAVFVNLGIPGATVADALDRELPQALELEPDLVTVWLNVNDLVAGVSSRDYETRLDTLLSSLRRGGRTRVLVANTPPLDRLPAYLACRPDPPPEAPPCLVGMTLPPPGALDTAIDSYNQAIERAAERNGAEVVDLHAVALAARAAGTEEELVSADGFHPSADGAIVVAEAFAATLKEAG
jgi:acyl-CoA thioesterase I